MNLTLSVQVAAIVPFSGFGSDELLLVPGEGEYALPSGNVQPGERVLGAASRIVLEMTGLGVVSVRLLYVIEEDPASITFGVLCEPGDSGDEARDLTGEIVRVLEISGRFQPVALFDMLVEDLRSGFVRPVGHVVVTGKTVNVSW